MDVLYCVEKLEKEDFSLQDVYGYTDYLQKRHQDNHNVQPKIRQQLQVLRDKGYLEFLGGGKYRIKR